MFDLCMTWLTTPRSSRQLAQLREHTACRCMEALRPEQADVFKNVMHRKMTERFTLRQANDPYHLDMFIDVIVSILSYAVNDALDGPSLYKVDRRRRKKPTHPQYHTKHWPERINQLLPHGAEDSVRALLAWLETREMPMILPSIIQLLKYLVEAGQQLIIQYIVTAPLFAQTLARFLMGRYMLWRGDEAYDPPVASVKDDAGPIGSVVLAGNFYGEIYQTTDLEQRIYFSDGCGTGRASEFARLLNCMLAWIRGLESTCESLTEDQRLKLDIAWKNLSPFACFLYNHYVHMRQQPRLYLQEILDEGASLEAMYHHPVFRAFFAFMDLYNSKRCAAPECNATYSSAERKFKHCAGCDRMAYCSVACQHLAWRHPSLPHHSICRTLRVLADAGQLPREVEMKDLRTFLDVYLRAAEDQPKGIRAAKAVASHITALQKAKLFRPGRSIAAPL